MISDDVATFYVGNIKENYMISENRTARKITDYEKWWIIRLQL